MAQAATQSMLTLTNDSTRVIDNEGAADGLQVAHLSFLSRWALERMES